MGTFRFSQRWDQPEIMDDLEFSGQEMDQALRELEVINKWLGGNNVTLAGLNRLRAHLQPGKPLTLADMGCGGGDMLMLMADWGRQLGLDLRLTGIDANAYVIDYARKHTEDYPEIDYQVANVFDAEFQQQQYDIIASTLFTHHFTQHELGQLIAAWMRQSRLGVIVNDLHRHWLAYYSIIGITRLLSKSYMVKNDGPVSVLRSFRRQDFHELMRLQNIQNYALQWHWAFRWLLVITNSVTPSD